MNKYILAIESAVRGGSIALLRDDDVIASISGDEGVSRAEDLLPNIKRLLGDAGGTVGNVSTIAVSRGPGSFTGIRIGIATAMGLARSLDIPIAGVPLLNAIATGHSTVLPVIAVVPVGRSDIAWGYFLETGEKKVNGPCGITDIEGFKEICEKHSPAAALLHEFVYEQIAGQMPENAQFVNIGGNMASIIGKHFGHWLDTNDLSPIYLQNPARAGNLF